MVCGDCVKKLAYKLVNNHNVDLIRAFELAEKGVERVEKRPIIGKGNPSDYTQPCEHGTPYQCTCTFFFGSCIGPSTTDCNCACPDPLANSHEVEDNCVEASGNCNSDPPTCSCYCSECDGNNCGYDCDEGYTWNEGSQECVPTGPPPTGRVSRGDGLVWIVQ